MGGGPALSGGRTAEFHHTTTSKRTERVRALGPTDAETLGTPSAQHNDRMDQGQTCSSNTFLSYFMGKYAQRVRVRGTRACSATQSTGQRKINFMNMTTEAIEALGEAELRRGT